MPGPDSVGANEKWVIVIEVQGTLERAPTLDFKRAINDAVKAARTATNPAKARITFSNTGPVIGESGVDR